MCARRKKGSLKMFNMLSTLLLEVLKNIKFAP